MKIVFGTTNKRKVEDLQNLIHSLKLNIEILGMNDIGWDRGEIEENGTTINENSLIKANAIHSFCQEKHILYPIITDDAGLFCDALEGKPGVFTARYAEEELVANPELPKYQCVIKLLKELENNPNRIAYYRCAITYMDPNGKYFQEIGQSKGHIADTIIGELKKPYFYSVFVLDGTEKAFSDITDETILNNTYRYNALKKVLIRIKDKYKSNEMDER